MKTFRQALQNSDFTITAELSLQHGIGVDEMLRQAENLQESVVAFQVAENPHSGVQMSAAAAAGLLVRNGFDAITGLNGRDRNRIALHSDLLGLRAMGITSLMLTRDSQLQDGQELGAKPVFDVGCRELVAIASAMNDEESSTPASEFLIGTNARVCTPGPEWTAEPLLARAGAGARFLQTQLCFDTSVLRQYMQRLIETRLTWDYSVIVSLAPLPGAEAARCLLENNPDYLIPVAVIERLESAKDRVAEGISICAELMREIATIPGVSGVNLMTLGNPASIQAAIENSGLQAVSFGQPN